MEPDAAVINRLVIAVPSPHTVVAGREDFFDRRADVFR
jgi:hypothetical protein